MPVRPRLDLASPAAFLWLAGGYVLLHFALRLVFNPVLGTDDVEQAVYAQTLAWGYDLKQPPLYTWLQWALDRLVGTGVHSHALLKYLLLFATYYYLYRCGRLVFMRAESALLAAAALALTYPFAVSIHQGVSHSILLSALLAATLYVFLELERRPSLAGYLGLGLLIGLGLISKYSYAVFAAALALAALSLPRYRRVVWHPYTLAGLLLAALVCVPHGLWVLEHRQAVGQAMAGLGQPAGAPGLGERLTELAGLASSALQFPAPLWLILLAVYPRALGRAGRSDNDAVRLLGRLMLIGLGLLAVAVLLGKLGEIKPRWLHPVLLVLPLWFFLRAEAAYPDGLRKRGYLTSLIVLPLLVIALWAAQTYLAPRQGKPTRFHAPYDRLAEGLRQIAANPATIVAGDEFLAGNLRLAFPAARVVNARYPAYRPGPPAAGPCLVVWEGDAAMPAAVAGLLAGQEAAAAGMLSEPYRYARDQALTIRYLATSAANCP